MNPVINKMEQFMIILNYVQAFPIVAKTSILNVVDFFNPPLHCNKFAAKAVGRFRSKRMVTYTCISQWKVLNKLKKHILDSLTLSNLQH